MSNTDNPISLRRHAAGSYRYEGKRGSYMAEQDFEYLDGEWRVTFPDGDQDVAVGLWQARLWIAHHEEEQS